MYLYDENGKVLKDNSGNIIKKLAGTMEEFEQEFKIKIFISEKFLGEKAIIENEKAREMTRLEKVLSGVEELQDGEYIKDNEIIMVEKPNNFHFWDSNLNKWVYDKELEINALEEEIGTLEGEISGLYDELDKATARKLKMREKQLNEEIEKLNEKIENKYKRYNELAG